MALSVDIRSPLLEAESLLKIMKCHDIPESNRQSARRILDVLHSRWIGTSLGDTIRLLARDKGVWL